MKGSPASWGSDTGPLDISDAQTLLCEELPARETTGSVLASEVPLWLFGVSDSPHCTEKLSLAKRALACHVLMLAPWFCQGCWGHEVSASWPETSCFDIYVLRSSGGTCGSEVFTLGFGLPPQFLLHSSLIKWSQLRSQPEFLEHRSVSNPWSLLVHG